MRIGGPPPLGTHGSEVRSRRIENQFRNRSILHPARQAGRVVDLAMAAGLLHRDLHPDILIGRRGADGSAEVFLLDLDRAELRPDLTADARDRMLVRMARYF